MKYTPEVLKRAEAEAASIASGSPQWDNTAVKLWSADFTRVAIPSRRIGETQNAYFRAAQPMAQKPLIVSLHT